MYKLIERYMNNLSIEQVKDFSFKKNILLSDNELSFTYDFIKKNWQFVLANHGVVDISRYKDKFSEENFIKINQLIKEFSQKYSHLL